MADIIRHFSGYINNLGNAPRTVQNAQELKIARRHSELVQRLGELRAETMKFSYIDPKTQAVKISQGPGYDALQAQITAEDAHLQKIAALAGRIDEVLEGFGAESIAELQALQAQAADIIRSMPYDAWRKLEEARGQGRTGAANRMSWLPSDIAALPEFKEAEASLRAQLEAAKADKEKLDAAIARAGELAAEATAI
jgi:hypothetical protein